MNKKKFLSFFLIWIIFFQSENLFSAPINLSHKSWEYSDIFNLEIKFSQPVEKVLRTKNPNWSPDEMFVYEEKIPIKYSQDIWYFWLLGWYNATNFFIQKFKLRIDPTKFIYWFKISKFSPYWDWIEIKNEWKNERMAIWRTISNLNWEEKIPDFRLKPWETTKISLKIWDYMDRLKLLDPNWQTQFKIQYKWDLEENEFYEREFWKNIFRIKKISR